MNLEIFTHDFNMCHNSLSEIITEYCAQENDSPLSVAIWSDDISMIALRHTLTNLDVWQEMDTKYNKFISKNNITFIPCVLDSFHNMGGYYGTRTNASIVVVGDNTNIQTYFNAWVCARCVKGDVDWMPKIIVTRSGR